MQKYYKAEMDRPLKIMTRVVWVLLALPPIAMTAGCWVSKNSPGSKAFPPPLVVAGVALLMWAIAHFTRALAPRGFALNDIELEIDRARSPIKIPLTSITEARKLGDAEVKGMLRLMGASGFYGHYGWFWNRKLGRFRLYASRLKDLVLVKTHKTAFVLSPEDTGTFIADLGKLLKL